MRSISTPGNKRVVTFIMKIKPFQFPSCYYIDWHTKCLIWASTIKLFFQTCENYTVWHWIFPANVAQADFVLYNAPFAVTSYLRREKFLFRSQFWCVICMLHFKVESAGHRRGVWYVHLLHWRSSGHNKVMLTTRSHSDCVTVSNRHPAIYISTLSKKVKPWEVHVCLSWGLHELPSS